MKIQTLTTKMVHKISQKGFGKKESKKILMMLFVSFVLLVSLNYVSAYKLLCLKYGQSVPNAENPRYTCWHDSCTICVTDNLNPANINSCKSSGNCQTLNSDGTIDSNPPELTVNSPENDAVYNSSKVLFDIIATEPATLSYLDSRGRWKRLVSLSQAFKKYLNFDDGLNNITIRGQDRNGNEVLVSKQFYVDSEEPNVRSIEPRKGFANGMFEVQFSEENPKQVILHYGNVMSGMRENIVDMNNCILERGRYTCQTMVDLNDYDGEDITAYFHVIDIADTSDESKHVLLDVDATAPVLKNPDSFWMVHENHIMFSLQIEELNFEEASYIDTSDSRPREKKLCTKLKNGMCEKKASFKTGHHTVELRVKDEAGNMITKNFDFDIV